MEKITVSKEVAQELKGLLYSGNWSRETIMEQHVRFGWETASRLVLNELSTSDMAAALFIGFTSKTLVKKFPTKEEAEVSATTLLGHYDFLEDSPPFSYRDGVKSGIRYSLNQLNITIDGINN